MRNRRARKPPQMVTCAQDMNGKASFDRSKPSTTRSSSLRAFGPATQKALEQARTREEWNTYLLSSPEFMSR